MTNAEQVRIEFSAPAYLKNTTVILVDTGLRPFKELMPMKKGQVDSEPTHVCHTARRQGRRRSLYDPNAPARGLARIQALQSGEAHDDARSVG